jgi:hypothetical protein
VPPSGPPLVFEPEGDLGSCELEVAPVSEMFLIRRSIELCEGLRV